MKKVKVKKKFRSFLIWTLWVLLVQFVLINISAALYAQNKLVNGESVQVKAIDGVRYVLPSRVYKGEGFVTITSASAQNTETSSLKF